MPDKPYTFDDLTALAAFEDELENVHAAVAESLTREQIWEAGRNLGLLSSESDEVTEEQLDILLSFTMYGQRFDGVTPLARWLEAPSIPLGEELQAALRQARFTLLVPVGFEEPYGIEARDLITDERVFVFEPFLGELEEEARDFVLATWLLPHPRFLTTNTSLMLIPGDLVDEVVEPLQEKMPAVRRGGLGALAKADAAALVEAEAAVIGAILRKDLLLGFEYEEEED